MGALASLSAVAVDVDKGDKVPVVNAAAVPVG